MWIKAEDGNLHNLDHIHTLEVNIEPGGYYIVKARFAEGNGVTAELTRHGARAQAKRTLDAIAEAIQTQGHREGFLDLNYLHNPKGSHVNAMNVETPPEMEPTANFWQAAAAGQHEAKSGS